MRRKNYLSFQLFVLSLCALAAEMILFRLYTFLVGFHFVSLIISLALLGYGAAGSLYRHYPLSLRPLIPLFFLFGMFAVFAGFVILPLDVYQFWTYAIHKVIFVILVIFTAFPFFYHGLFQLLLFEKYPDHFPRFYSINLIGSALGVITGIVFLMFMNEIRSLLGLAVIACLASFHQKKFMIPIIIFIVVLYFSPLSLKLSDYSPSRQLKLIPENQLLQTYHNPSQNLDVYFTPYSRAAAGLSMLYRDIPPSAYTLVYDHNLQHFFPYHPSQEFLQYTLFSLPIRIFNPNNVLGIECDWGYEIYALWYSGVTGKIITSSPLYGAFLDIIHLPSRIQRETAFPRKFLSRNQTLYDLIFLQVPIGSADVFPGSFSLKENYLFTIEGMRLVMKQLQSDGKLVISFFPQTPPVVLIKMLDIFSQVWGSTVQLRNQMIIIKNLDLVSMIISKNPFSNDEMNRIRQDVHTYWFDFIYYPGIHKDEAEIIFQNQKINYQAVIEYLRDSSASLQKSFYYVRAPSDNSPNFFHFFKWRQTMDTIYNLGKRWLPFGGAGFLLVFFVLAVIASLSFLFILIPGRFLIRMTLSFPGRRYLELAAIMTGAGYMLIEIPVIAQLEMIIGFPLYTFAVVLSVLLIFSGLGSLYVEKIRSTAFFHRLIIIHPLVLIGYLLFINGVQSWLLSLPEYVCMIVTFLPFSLVSFLAGMPFPVLSRLTQKRNPEFFPAVFAWNGFVSVIATLLSHLTAVQFGIRSPYLLSIPIYSGFWIVTYTMTKSTPPGLHVPGEQRRLHLNFLK